MRRTIAALQRMGCKVAIDDVGTGHSGLSYILKLGVDIIKIDKIFVEAIGSEGHSKAIIETLIDLAKNMRMEIVAEGVETFDQVTYLRERGIGAAQGYRVRAAAAGEHVPAIARSDGSGRRCGRGRPTAKPVEDRPPDVEGGPPLNRFANRREPRLPIALRYAAITALLRLKLDLNTARSTCAGSFVWGLGVAETQVARSDRHRRGPGGTAGGGVEHLARAAWSSGRAGKSSIWRPGGTWRCPKARIGRAVATLDELAARGINSCRAAHVDALRQTTFATMPVKELSIVAPDGRTLCTDVGNQPEQRKVVSSEPLAAGSRMLLEWCGLADSRSSGCASAGRAAGAANGVAALIPAALFVPQVSTGGGPLSFHARMLTAGGTVIAEAGGATAGADRDDV